MAVAVSTSRVVLFVLVFILSFTPVSSSTTGASNCSTTLSYPRPRMFNVIFSGCNATLQGKEKEEIQGATTVILVPVLYLISFVFGFPANLLALWVLLFRTKKLPSTILLINLTCCDLLLLLMLPFRISYHFQGNNWTFGEGFCRVLIALFYGNMYGSVICLALIAIDRYVALVHPFGAKTLRSRKTSILMSMIVWVMVVIAAVPLLASRQSYSLNNPSITTCHDALPEKEQENYLPYFGTLFCFGFLLPLFVVVFCYSAVLRTLMAAGGRYSHATRVTALVLVVFIVCLLPSNILLLMHYSKLLYTNNSRTDYDDPEVEEFNSSFEKYSQLYVPYMISLAISTFNSSIDPFIFYYVSEDFRKKAKNLLCCSKASYESSSGSSSQTMRSKVTLLSVSKGKTGELSQNTGANL